MARRPRNLTEEEKSLWKKVADNTERLHPSRPIITPLQKEPTRSVPNVPDVKHPQFRVGQAAASYQPRHDIAPSIADHVAAQSLAMDKKTFGRMRKGRLSPEARIDLHGMTIAQAQPVLTEFIMKAASEQKRLVLVITGKGKHRDDGGPIPVRHGVLRHQVPHWLQTPPLRSLVLQLTEAHLKHGGQGAYYVYLRRNR